MIEKTKIAILYSVPFALSYIGVNVGVLITLCVLFAIDVVTGIIKSYVRKDISSSRGQGGVLYKVLILIIILSFGLLLKQYSNIFAGSIDMVCIEKILSTIMLFISCLEFVSIVQNINIIYNKEQIKEYDALSIFVATVSSTLVGVADKAISYIPETIKKHIEKVK